LCGRVELPSRERVELDEEEDVLQLIAKPTEAAAIVTATTITRRDLMSSCLPELGLPARLG
jgi:hypothetical protein